MNFITIFKEFTSSNSQIREGLINTLIFFAFNNFIILPLCYLSAYFIYKKILMHSVFKYVFFIPSIVSAVILTSFLKFMLSPNGPITILWGNIFGDAPIFLSDSRYAMPVLLFYNLWTGFGVQLIYFHASLVRIPKDVIEYATLDGVTPFQELIHILFPLTFPFYMTFVILGFGGIFSASGPVLLLTEGAYGTMDLAYWSFVTLTTDYVNGTSLVAALGQLETLIALPIALFAKKLSDRIETVEY